MIGLLLLGCTPAPPEETGTTPDTGAASPTGVAVGRVWADAASTGQTLGRASFPVTLVPGTPGFTEVFGECTRTTGAVPDTTRQALAGPITWAGGPTLAPVEEYSEVGYLPAELPGEPWGARWAVSAEGDEIPAFSGTLTLPDAAPDWTADGASLRWAPGGATLTVTVTSTASPGTIVRCVTADDGAFTLPAGLLPSPDRPLVELARERAAFVQLDPASYVTLAGRAARLGAVDLP